MHVTYMVKMETICLPDTRSLLKPLYVAVTVSVPPAYVTTASPVLDGAEDGAGTSCAVVSAMFRLAKSGVNYTYPEHDCALVKETSTSRRLRAAIFLIAFLQFSKQSKELV
jgi:hypothetical protein